MWKSFHEFSLAYFQKIFQPPLPVHILSMYVTHLYGIGLQARTIQSHLSAISFVHKIRCLPDPTQRFFISKLMAGISKQIPSQDKRLPITASLLKKLVPAVCACSPTPYESALYGAMVLLAYHACLRVGEMALSNNAANVLQLEQINPVKSGDCITAYIITFEHYKHSGNSKPVLQVNADRDANVCPVQHLSKYIVKRGQLPGALFQNSNRTTVSRLKFHKIVQAALTCLKIPAKLFNTHSFRIGRCTDLANQGYSEAQIKLIGRYKSSAFTRYIRPTVIVP